MAESFEEIRVRLERGEPGAETEIFNRFADRLVRKARSRLNKRLKQKVGASDVVQSVFRTFFRRLRQGEFPAKDWTELSRILATITIRKCNRQAEKYQADRRDVRREANLQDKNDNSAPLFEPQARAPTPDEVIMLSDMMQQIMEQLDERQRQVLELVLAEYTRAEIAQQLGCSERTVYRNMNDIKDIVVKLGYEPSADAREPSG